MNDPNEHSRSSRVSSVNVSAQSVDMDDRQAFGKAFFALLYRVLRVAAIYEADHETCQEATEELVDFFNAAMARRSSSDAIELAIRGDFGIVNGETLQLTSSAQRRLRELRTVFADAGFRGVTLARGMTTRQFERFLTHLHRVLNNSFVDDLEAANIPNVDIEFGQPNRPLEEGLADVDRRSYSAHLFVRALIKIRRTHRTYRKEGAADFPIESLREITRRFADLLAHEEWRLLGLPTLRLLSSRLATHSLNTAVYATHLAISAGLPSRTAGELGAAVLIDDFRRLKGLEHERSRAGRPADYDQNLAALAEHVGSPPSSTAQRFADIIAFERGLPLDTPTPDGFYMVKRNVHAAGRIVQIAREYDSLVQGFGGHEAHLPSRALTALLKTPETQCDPALTRLFATAMGTYPVGMRVRLSNGQRAIVVEPPRQPSEPERPVVQLLDDEQRNIDLGAPRYSAAQITGAVDSTDASDSSDSNDPNDVFLLS